MVRNIIEIRTDGNRSSSLLGVDNSAWYVEKESDAKQSKAALAIQQVNQEPSFEDRENIYEENRKEMQVEFRSQLSNVLEQF